MENKKPLVSVIMPLYNAEKFVYRSVSSILDQNYDNFELILCDDKSTDNTLDVVKKINDSRIKLIANEENKGIAYSTNRAIEHASGKYIALLDDDDMAFENRLELQVDYLEKNKNIDVLGGRSIFINENDEYLGDSIEPRNNPKYIAAMLLFQCVDFGNGTLMYRKDFIDKNNIKYREDCYGMQDFRFLVDASKVGNITTIPNFILKSREHNENLTNKIIKLNFKERERAFAKIQRDSLYNSGFQLTEEQYNLINKAMKEFGRKLDDFDEIIKLKNVFDELIKQAEKNKLPYLNELKFFLKKKLEEVLTGTNIFH